MICVGKDSREGRGDDVWRVSVWEIVGEDRFDGVIGELRFEGEVVSRWLGSKKLFEVGERLVCFRNTEKVSEVGVD